MLTTIIGDWEDYEITAAGERRFVARGRNAISVDLSVIIAMCLKTGASAGQGILYWAVGDGGIDGTDTATASTAWDAAILAGTTHANTTDTGLIRETFRKAIDSADVTFVDASGTASAVPTNRLRIQSTFLEAEPSGSVVSWFREWGVIGGTKLRDGTGGTPSTLNSGFLVDHKLHATFGKQPTSRLERVLFLTF